MANPDWSPLRAALCACRAAGTTPRLWWRDDDAVSDTPALRRMLALSNSFDVPLGVAVIPARVEKSLAPAVRGISGIEVLLHGYAHTNHEPDGAKKAEIGANRSLSDSLEDLRAGWHILSECFDRQALPILVPPWNRIHPDIAASLPTVLGLPSVGLSPFKPRSTANVGGNVRIANTHCDPIDWKGMKSQPAGSAFLGTEASLAQIVGHLQAKRRGTVDANEPTGILTHHLVEPEACTDFMKLLFKCISSHSAAGWLTPSDVFGLVANLRLASGAP